MPPKSTPKRLIAFLILIAAVAPSVRTVASEEAAPPGHFIVVTIPDGWERRNGLADPVVLAAVERGIGDSFGLLAFKQPDGKFTLNRKSAETGLLNEIGPTGKILRRADTRLVGVAAYCLIAETQVQGRNVSLARIMTERPVNGFIYAVQYSKMAGGDFDDAAIQAIIDRVHLKGSK